VTASEAGIVRPDQIDRDFTLDRLAAVGPLAAYVERYWSVQWDRGASAERGDQPQVSQVVPHPAVNVTFESGSPGEVRHGHSLPAGLVHGVVTRRFDIELAGVGRVFGAKLRPGALTALTGIDASTLRDRAVTLAEVFGDDARSVADVVLAEEDDLGRRHAVEAWLEPWADRLAGPPAAYQQVLELVAASLADRTLIRVADLCARFDLTERQLQRLFVRYVGVGPKWVLRRHRLHDAQERLVHGDVTDLAALAVELGWHDQAHFTREFTGVLGTSPSRYLGQLHHTDG